MTTTFHPPSRSSRTFIDERKRSLRGGRPAARGRGRGSIPGLEPVLCCGLLLFGATAARAAPAHQVSVSRPGNCAYPQWSRDGRSLAYERIFVEERRIELNVLHNAHQSPTKEERIKPTFSEDEATAKSVVSAFKQESAVESGQICRELAWGPVDAPATFVYSCNVSGGAYQLFMSGGEQITHGRGVSGQADLSSAGWRLAYIRAREGTEGIFAIFDLLEQLQPVELLSRGKRLDRMPAWSPDGQALAFVGHSKKGGDLFLIKNVQSPKKSMTRITKWSGDENNPSWSPDGKRLAFYADRGQDQNRRREGPARYGIFITEASGKSPPFLLAKDVVASEHAGPAWTPDGRHIVFVKDVQEGSMVDPLRIIAAEPGAKEQPIESGTVANRDPQLAVHKGRWHLAFSALGLLEGGSRTWSKIYTMDVDHLRAPTPAKDDASPVGN